MRPYFRVHRISSLYHMRILDASNHISLQAGHDKERRDEVLVADDGTGH